MVGFPTPPVSRAFFKWLHCRMAKGRTFPRRIPRQLQIVTRHCPLARPNPPQKNPRPFHCLALPPKTRARKNPLNERGISSVSSGKPKDGSARMARAVSAGQFHRSRAHSSERRAKRTPAGKGSAFALPPRRGSSLRGLFVLRRDHVNQAAREKHIALARGEGQAHFHGKAPGYVGYGNAFRAGGNQRRHAVQT